MNEVVKILLWFVAWVIPGLLLPGFFMFLPFGALVIPGLVALVVVILIRFHHPRGPEILGVLLGIASWGFATAYFNRESNPCPESGSARTELGPGESFSCGGVAPAPFLFAGVLLAAVAVLGATVWTAALRSKR